MKTACDHNLSKLSLAELEELHERQKSIVKNKKLIAHLPDKGKQLEDKLEKVKKELEIRKNIRDIEGAMKGLSIDSQHSDILNVKHVQHVCQMEKSPKKERYKPSSTLIPNSKNKTEKPTQLISLPESIVLLAEQATKLPIEQVKKVIEGTEMKEKDEDEELDP